jgi:sRNA-binding protein
MKIGDRVHVNTDSEEWGRVASDATIVDVFGDGVQVEVDSIRATITVDASMVSLKSDR